MKRTIFTCILAVLILALLPSLAQPATAEELTVVSKGVEITANKPAVGMAVNDLTAQVYKAQLEGIHVYKAYTGEEVTEGFFEQGIVYSIHYVLTPQEGTKFAERVGVTLHGYHMYTAESETRLVCQYTFETCLNINSTKFTIPLLKHGMKPEDVELTIPSNSHLTVENFKFIDLQDNSDATEFLREGKYRLQFTVIPDHGYMLFQGYDAFCNGAEMVAVTKNCDTYAECYIDFSLDVGAFHIDGGASSVNMKSGATLSKHSVVDIGNDRVTASNVRWLDSQKNVVTNQKVVGGETYYLAIDLHPAGPAGPWETPDITLIGYAFRGRSVSVEVVSETCATAYIHFTGLFPMGKVQITYQGFEQGEPVKGLTAEIQGNAKLSVSITDENSKTVTDGIFETGKKYYLAFYVYPLDGYYVQSSPSIILNGEECKGSVYSNYARINRVMDTRYIVETAKVKISGVGVGKTISKVKITPASGSKFSVWDENWSATNTSSTKFKKGELYQVRVTLDCNSAYRFTKDTVFTIGGKKAMDVVVNSDGDRIYGTVQFSYQTKIKKVTLPAMPKSVSLGAILPTNFKVSSSAKYTLTPVWIAMSTQKQIATATQKDCYVLTYVPIPKKGYEFTEDTVFYVGGKKVTPVIVTTFAAEIMKVYNVGLTEVDRIDLTIPEPEHGAAPGTVTVADDAPYTAIQQAWVVNTSGKLDDDAKAVTVFENYKYHFLAVEFQTKSGYAFADKVSVYINGNKHAVVEDYVLGTAYQMAVSFGKLGEIAKLTAPELTKNGLTLSWGSVRNADAYEIYRATSKSGKYTKVATISETTWTDSPTAGKTYYYKVKAVFTPDTSKNSGYSKYVSIAYQCVAPESSATNDAKGKPYITWSKVSGAKKYTVYRATSEAGKYKKLSTTKKLYYTDSKASAGTTYYYKIIANASSSKYNSPYSNIVSCDVICGTPSVTVKVNAATGKPSLSWKKITGAVSYDIYRDGQLLQSTTALSYTDATAEIGKTYTYTVQAIGKQPVHNSQLSGEKHVTATCAQPKISGKVGENKKPVIAWGEVEGAVKYEIYRSTSKSKGYKVIGESETLTYEDLTAKKGKTYYYKVVAVGNGIQSAQSSYVKVKSK